MIGAIYKLTNYKKKGEVIVMQTAKLFINGSSQSVRLPNDFRFQGDEVGVKRIGEIVLLYPKDSENLWVNFCICPSVTDEFADSVLESRSENMQSKRVAL